MAEKRRDIQQDDTLKCFSGREIRNYNGRIEREKSRKSCVGEGDVPEGGNPKLSRVNYLAWRRESLPGGGESRGGAKKASNAVSQRRRVLPWLG